MGGGFGGCTINLVKDGLYDNFIATAKEKFNAKYGHEPKVYEVVISDGSRRLEQFPRNLSSKGPIRRRGLFMSVRSFYSGSRDCVVSGCWI